MIFAIIANIPMLSAYATMSVYFLEANESGACYTSAVVLR